MNVMKNTRCGFHIPKITCTNIAIVQKKVQITLPAYNLFIFFILF